MVSRNVVSISGQIRDPSFDYFKADLISYDRQHLSAGTPVTCIFMALDKYTHQRRIDVAFVFLHDCTESRNISAQCGAISSNAAITTCLALPV